MTDDPAFYDRALARLDRIALIVGAVAVLAFFVREGWRAALGCAVTAAASIYNLRRLKRMAAGLADSGRSGSAGSAVLVGMRFLLLGGICFVIINYLGVSMPAVFTGLLVSVAAVLIEILYELIFTH